MNCREAEHHIYAERDGALNANQRAGLAEHVSRCAACQKTQQVLSTAVRRWSAATLDAQIPDMDREWAKLRREIRSETEPVRTRLGWIAIPIAGAAAVAIGLYLAPIRGPKNLPTDAIAVAASESATSSPDTTSTVVYVDDKSGWTFVLAGDSNAQQHI